MATSARAAGKPRIVEQKYLGTAADIEAAMAGATRNPARTRHLAFGDLAATWQVLEWLDVAGVVDAVVGDRRADAGASVGTYLALATLNRVVAPCSKLAFASWWATTAGDHLVTVKPAALDHRRFWDAMHTLDTDALTEIERRIAAAAIQVFDLDISSPALDNFATFIDSANDRAAIAARGKAKQKRTDLRLVGLGLVITRDGSIPLASQPYPGDRPRRDPVRGHDHRTRRAVPRPGRRSWRADRGLRRRAELRPQRRVASPNSGWATWDRCRPPTTRTCSTSRRRATGRSTSSPGYRPWRSTASTRWDRPTGGC